MRNVGRFVGEMTQPQQNPRWRARSLEHASEFWSLTIYLPLPFLFPSLLPLLFHFFPRAPPLRGRSSSPPNPPVTYTYFKTRRRRRTWSSASRRSIRSPKMFTQPPTLYASARDSAEQQRLVARTLTRNLPLYQVSLPATETVLSFLLALFCC